MRELKQSLRALSDISRLRIIEALGANAEMRVSDLAVRLKISQPLVSWHLAFLRRAGLVVSRRQGRTHFCSLNRERWTWVIAELNRLVAGAPDSASPELVRLAGARDDS